MGKKSVKFDKHFQRNGKSIQNYLYIQMNTQFKITLLRKKKKECE